MASDTLFLLFLLWHFLQLIRHPDSYQGSLYLPYVTKAQGLLTPSWLANWALEVQFFPPFPSGLMGRVLDPWETQASGLCNSGAAHTTESNFLPILSECHHPVPREINLLLISLKARPTLIKGSVPWCLLIKPNVLIPLAGGRHGCHAISSKYSLWALCV